MSAVGLQIFQAYYWYWGMSWGDIAAVHSWRLGPPSPLPHVALMSAFGGPPPLRTLAVCRRVFPLGSPSSVQSCDSAPCRRSTTATFFSSCCSPSGRAPRKTGRRLPARGCPSPSRHTGTTPCFPYESHIQLCPLPRARPPAGSWEEEREEGKGVRDLERDRSTKRKGREAMRGGRWSWRHISAHCN